MTAANAKTGRSSSMRRKVWGDHEMDCTIVRADTFHEAVMKGRQYDPMFYTGQALDPSCDIERLEMEPDIKR